MVFFRCYKTPYHDVKINTIWPPFLLKIKEKRTAFSTNVFASWMLRWWFFFHKYTFYVERMTYELLLHKKNDNSIQNAINTICIFCFLKEITCSSTFILLLNVIYLFILICHYANLWLALFSIAALMCAQSFRITR